jgi:hypothetical protein
MNSRRVLPALALLLVLAGCGPFGGQSASENAEPGDPKPGTYVNDQYRYSLNAPGPMTSASKATATYFGPEERLEVVAVEGASAADPAALADKDISGLKASIPDLKVVSGPAPVTLGDRRVIKVMYTGTVDNPTTGKPIKLTSARYYIPKDKALLAVVTFGDKSEEFDPKEADGIAKSFRWL